MNRKSWSAGIGVGMVACTSAWGAAMMPAIPETSTERFAEALSPAPCVRAFSKDACAGAFGSGNGVYSSCPVSSVPCDTLSITGQKWQFSLRSNPTPSCADPVGVLGSCDEVKDGRFEAKVDVLLRMNQPCRYRGCLNGEAMYYSDDGAIYAGRIGGTLGAGTDRTPRCPTSTLPPFLPQGCERCHDVELQGSSPNQMWPVGVDAFFQGVRIDADTGEEICITISGDFFAPGSAHGIFDPVNGWRYYGTADGVYHFYCP